MNLLLYFSHTLFSPILFLCFTVLLPVFLLPFFLPLPTLLSSWFLLVERLKVNDSEGNDSVTVFDGEECFCYESMHQGHDS